MMPRLGGFDVCQHLRARPRASWCPSSCSPGLDDGESVERAFQVGATDFISKPINWTLLRFRIRYVLRSAQVMQELVRNKESLSSAQRIARLGSWEWFVTEDRVQRSAQYYRLFGQQPETFGERMEACSITSHARPADGPGGAEGRGEGPGYQLTYRVVWPDGSVRTVLETAEPAEAASTCCSRAACRTSPSRSIPSGGSASWPISTSTGLPNREFFRESLLSAVARRLRNDSACAVMVLDIDRFARINDSLGPERGDQVLQVIGHRLRESMGDRTPAEPAGGGSPPAQGGTPRRRRVRRAGQRRGAGG